MINWNCDKDDSMDYYYHTVTDKEKELDAFVEWWCKIVELSEGKEDWNAIIADMWIDNTGRIIGHIQRNDQAVGYDRGFRVSLTIKRWVDELNKAFDSENEDLYYDVINDAFSEAVQLLQTSAKKSPANEAIKALNVKNSFDIFHAWRGSCDWDGECMIDF